MGRDPLLEVRIHRSSLPGLCLRSRVLMAWLDKLDLPHSRILLTRSKSGNLCRFVLLRILCKLGFHIRHSRFRWGNPVKLTLFMLSNGVPIKINKVRSICLRRINLRRPLLVSKYLTHDMLL